MKTYLIEPTAPLVFRSGKPFGSGMRDGARFPPPSSLAGTLRTAWWNQGGRGLESQDLYGLASAGPWLVRRQGDTLTPMLPKPADALYLLDESAQRKVVARLRPGHLDGADCDLPEGLAPVVLEADLKGKPQTGPTFWPLETVLSWRRGVTPDFDKLDDAEPAIDLRTHVALDRKTLAAATGQLFQIEGLDFGARRIDSGFSATTWALLARFDADFSQSLPITLGGERRLSWLSCLDVDPLALPAEHKAALESAKGLSLTLATPALFEGGWKPGWLGADLTGTHPAVPGLRLKLHAAAIERWQGVSGWDLEHNQPRAARKAVAAGAVYWFEILDKPAGWVDRLWLAPLNDDAQDSRNGFGLAVPGPWQANS